jgi:hypothetical protein
MQNLTFHTAYGVRVAEAPINGEERAYSAKIVQQDSGYRCAIYTYGQLLFVGDFATLAEARAEANTTYLIVEGVNL